MHKAMHQRQQLVWFGLVLEKANTAAKGSQPRSPFIKNRFGLSAEHVDEESLPPMPLTDRVTVWTRRVVRWWVDEPPLPGPLA